MSKWPIARLEEAYVKFADQIESPDRQANRIIGVINRINTENEGQTICFVVHGDPIAFAGWRLRHPAGRIPTIDELKENNNYLNKGDAWRVMLDENNRVTQFKLITTESDITIKKS